MNSTSNGRTPWLIHIRGWLAVLLLVTACSDPAGPRRPSTAITYLESNATGMRDLVVMRPNGGEELARYHLPFLPDEVALSPDRHEILLSDREAGSISVMHVASGVTTMIVSESGADYPEWSADGQNILYYSPQNGGTAWVIGADGQTARPIAAGMPTIPLQYDPIWSPDGSRIMFNSPYDASGSRLFHRLYVMNADGSDIRLLPLDTTVVSDDAVEVSWSPDGSRIAFETAASVGYAIVVANADGSGARRVTDGSSLQRSPWWSPDGMHLVFVSPVKPQDSWRVQIIDLATGTVRLLTPDVDSPVDRFHPHWIEWP